MSRLSNLNIYHVCAFAREVNSVEESGSQSLKSPDALELFPLPQHSVRVLESVDETAFDLPLDTNGQDLAEKACIPAQTQYRKR